MMVWYDFKLHNNNPKITIILFKPKRFLQLFKLKIGSNVYPRIFFLYGYTHVLKICKWVHVVYPRVPPTTLLIPGISITNYD